MPTAEYSALKGIAERNQVYWREILYRSHFGACTGMLRLHEWLHGSERALADGNVLLLAAGIRGFLEACADTYKGFSEVPLALADSHTLARRAIKGKLSEQTVLAPELESSLIHFAFARKLRPGDGPALHNAETAKDCLSTLSEVATDVADVYQVLCDYTHPAAASLFRFADESADMLNFQPKAGPQKLAEITAMSAEVGKGALALAVAPLVTTLKVLNAFAFAPVATPWAQAINLSFSPAWRQLNERLKSQIGPTVAAADGEQESIIKNLKAQYSPFGKSKRQRE